MRKVVEDDGSVRYTWKPPAIPGGPRVAYFIQYGDTGIKIEAESFKISPTTNSKTYVVKVYFTCLVYSLVVSLFKFNAFFYFLILKNNKDKGFFVIDIYLYK